MSNKAESLRTVLRGAAWGALAWIIYGVVEAILSIGIQLWRFREMELLPWQWPLLGLLLGSYAVFGIVSGMVGGLLFARRKGENSCRIFIALTVVIAFGANLLKAWPLARSEQIALALVALLIAGFLAALLSAQWSQRVGSLASPWTVSFLILGAPAISRELLIPQDSGFKKISLSILFLFVVAALAFGKQALRRRSAGLVPAGATALAVLAAFAMTVMLVQRDRAVQPGAPTPGPAKPNVVLIVMDTVRADHLSLYGYSRDTSPNLRQFARESTVYTHAIAASDFTLATHATMFTGLYPDWNGAIQSATPSPIALPVGDRHTTVAALLHSRGYWTLEAGANSGFLGSWTGLTRGFDVSDLRRPVTLSDSNRPFYLREAVKRLLVKILPAQTAPFDRPFRTAADINRRAIELIDAASTNHSPFFLYVNYMDAHTPYLPAPPFDQRFPSSGKHIWLDPATLHDVKLQVDSGKRRLSPAESSYLISKYDGGIAAEDEAIDGLLNYLRSRGLYENTLIIVTADHGDTFGEHDLMDHFLGFVYQQLVHVPLLIKYPGQREGNWSDDLVSQVDFMPTVLDTLGVERSPELQGRSLLRPAPKDMVVFSRGTRSPLVGLENKRFAGLRRVIFSASLKLVDWTAGPPEMYDLPSDPEELHNIYSGDDARALDLRQRLESWVASFPRLGSQRPKLDPSATERLKSLGYVQ